MTYATKYFLKWTQTKEGKRFANTTLKSLPTWMIEKGDIVDYWVELNLTKEEFQSLSNLFNHEQPVVSPQLGHL